MAIRPNSAMQLGVGTSVLIFRILEHNLSGSVHKDLLSEAAQACENMVVESGKKLKAVDKVRLISAGFLRESKSCFQSMRRF